MLFTRPVIDLVLNNYPELSEGIWPDIEVGEVALKSLVVSCRAAFENPCLLAGEVSARIRPTGDDGYLVEEIYGMVTGEPKDVMIIAQQRHIYPEDIYKRIKKVKGYISDDKDHQGRRSESYADFKKRTRFWREYR